MKRMCMIIGSVIIFFVLFIFIKERKQPLLEESSNAAECFREVYEDAKNRQKLGSDEVMAEILGCFEKEGYTAVDMDNQFNMVNPEPMELFCRQVENGKESEATVYVILSSGAFQRYDFHFAMGNVQVKRSFTAWVDGEPKTEEVQEYEAGSWTWSDGSWLFFEERYPWDFEGTSIQIAFRVRPLDQKLRELNQKYVEPIGYYLNNMFITDWSESDYGELNFYDLFQPMYEMKYGEEAFLKLGYTEDQLYKIPELTFEAPFQSYFQIDDNTLREKNLYDQGSRTYEYRPRGLYDGLPPTGTPCPEVTAYEELGDGTLKLTVQAVWKSKQIEEAFVHELIVRPVSGEEFQYVSNRVIPSEENVEPVWYVERISQEQSGRIEPDGLEAMKRIMEEKNETDCPVVTDGFYGDMDQYEKMDEFLNRALKGRKCKETVYILHENQGFGRYCFRFDGEKMSLTHTIFSWSENGELLTTGTFCGAVRTWNYTDTGWFCYELDMPEPPEVSEVINGNEMIRIKPLQKEYRELAEKLLLPIGYQGNNLFCSNWDSAHMEKLDYNGLYEYLYAMEYGEKLDAGQYEEGVPAGEFEALVTKYLPVTKEQLREYAVYDSQAERYGWTGLGCGNYTPDVFGMSVPEIEKVTNMGDGIRSVRVRAVCEPLGTDRIFMHELTVRFGEDGEITYIGNHILEDEWNRSPEYQYRMGKPN